MNASTSTYSSRIATWMVRYRFELLALSVLLTTLAVFPASKVVMNRSISTMFAEDNPIMPPFRRLERVFSANDMVLAVYEDDELFTPAGLARVTEMQLRLHKIPGVKGILSVDKLMGEEILDEQLIKALKVKAMFQDFTHGADGKTTSIGCMLYPELESPISRSETITRLRQAIAKPVGELQPGTLAGEPVMIDDAFGYVDRDGKRLFSVTTILLSIVILGCFRRIRWVLIPIAVVQVALLLTNATVGMAQLELSMVSSILTAVVTVIGVATVVHVIVRYRESRLTGLSPVEALQDAGRKLAAPIFWACITDAVGFGSLMFAKVGPVRDFGMMMALGSLMVLVSVALLLPGLALWGPKPSAPRSAWGERVLDANLLNLVSLVYRFPWFVGSLAIGTSLIAIFGIRWLEVETDFTKNFRETTPIVKSYDIVESRLGGAGILDVVIPAPAPLDWEFLKQVLLLERDLKKNVVLEASDGTTHAGITKTLSLADVVWSFSPRNPQKIRRAWRSSYINTALKKMQDKLPVFYDALYGVDETSGQPYLRVMLRSKERQPSQQKKEIIKQITRITRERFPDAEITGYFTLLTGLIDSLLQDQWKTFGIALFGIFLTMTLAFRDLKLAMIATIPNALPILVVSGLMGWMGIKVNMGGAMIAAVSMGLSIDSSIHYLMAYRRARQKGMNLNKALAVVQQTVGRAMVYSTLALIIGFAAMAISEFVPTIYFGGLVSISMLGALIGNLVGLPILLRAFQSNAPVVVPENSITAAVPEG